MKAPQVHSSGSSSKEDAAQAVQESWLDAASPPPKGPLRFRRSKRRRRAPSSPQHMDPIEAEVERWFDLKWTPACEYQKKWSAGDWWGENHTSFPLVARLARRILATQVSG